MSLLQQWLNNISKNTAWRKDIIKKQTIIWPDSRMEKKDLLFSPFVMA